MADDARTGIIFDSVIWRGDHMVEISYTEERDRGDGACLVRTLVIDRRKLPEHDKGLIDTLIEFIDEGEVIVRNPPERLSRRG